MLSVIEWGSIGVKALQFIFSFSILVTLHELGHFITAKWFKCRVEKFYLFFNPWFSLWKKKVGETEYGIGWVPFGGYVKISGMVDESMDKEQLKQPPQPYEFRSKPAWQRLIIMIAGVVVNVLLALVLFILITYVWGEEFVPAKKVKYGIYADSLGRKLGLQNGDHILAVNHKNIETLEEVPFDILVNEAKTLQIERNGQLLELPIPDSFIGELNHSASRGIKEVRFINYLLPAVVDSVDGNIARFLENKLQKGDRIIAFNQHPVHYYNELDSLKKNQPNQVVPVQVLRGSDTVNIRLKLSEKSAIGFFPVNPYKLYGTQVHRYSLAESFPKGIRRASETLGNYITGLKQIVTGKVAAKDSLGSVISISKTFPSIWDWERFWTLTAIFSIILAFMNILPIPALDGGHALFTLVEMVSGRKPSDKFMEYAQLAGMVLLLGLMAYALGLDFWRLFR